nr:Os05g0449750 [Ipomoea batatas]
MGLGNSWNKVSVFAWADRSIVSSLIRGSNLISFQESKTNKQSYFDINVKIGYQPEPERKQWVNGILLSMDRQLINCSKPSSQAATRDSTLSRSCGSITIGLPEIRIITVGALSATKLAISGPFSGIVSEKMAISGNTLQPTISSKDLSANGCSNIPEMNLTLKILSTASSILAIGISPDCAKHSSSSRYNSNLKGTITCKQRSNQHYETPYLGLNLGQKVMVRVHFPSIPAGIGCHDSTNSLRQAVQICPPIAHEMLGTTNNFVSGYSDKILKKHSSQDSKRSALLCTYETMSDGGGSGNEAFNLSHLTDFLLESHPGQKVFHSLLHRSVWVLVNAAHRHSCSDPASRRSYRAFSANSGKWSCDYGEKSRR